MRHKDIILDLAVRHKGILMVGDDAREDFIEPVRQNLRKYFI